MDKFLKLFSNFVILALVACLGYVVSEIALPDNFVIVTERVSQKTDFVDVVLTGKIKNEGVYNVPAGTPIHDAIYNAGGLDDCADTSSINFDMPIMSDCKIHIPASDKNMVAADAFYEFSSDSVYRKCNINIATRKQLASLPGIGDGIAARIVDYRSKNGNFSSIYDLLDVKGIGRATISKIKDYITVGGEPDK